MYVVPYIMGPVNSPYSKVGVELTDIAYVVANMRIMSRMGKVALDRLGNSEDFVPGLHSLGDVNPERRFVLHFPARKINLEHRLGLWRKRAAGEKMFCAADRERDGARAGLDGRAHAAAGAGGSVRESDVHGRGVPERVRENESGDDGLGAAGAGLPSVDRGRRHRLDAHRFGRHAARDQSGDGIFRSGAGNECDHESERGKAVHHDTIFTNVAMTSSSHEPWWEGINGPPSEDLITWRGERWSAEKGPAAQPNSRYTVPAGQSPSISSHWQDPEGVPISALIFGGRRARVAPLVYESRDWQHGVFVGATMASETTVAITDSLGVTRRDPMAMLPFCGYNMADYFRHWLTMGRS